MKKSFISLLVLCVSVIFLSGFSLWSLWSVSPSSYYFSNVQWGESRDAQFTLTNNHWYPKEGTVSITNSHRLGWYSCVSGCSYYVEQGEEHTVTIRFTAPPYPPCDDQSTSSGATIEFPTQGSYFTSGTVGASVTGGSC